MTDRKLKIERTSAGPQYVPPGADRKTAPRSGHSAEPDGQLLLGEMQPVEEGERLALLKRKPLRPRVGRSIFTD